MSADVVGELDAVPEVWRRIAEIKNALAAMSDEVSALERRHEVNRHEIAVHEEAIWRMGRDLEQLETDYQARRPATSESPR